MATTCDELSNFSVCFEFPNFATKRKQQRYKNITEHIGPRVFL